MKRFRKSMVLLAAMGVMFCVSIPLLAQSPDDISMTTKTEVAIPGHLLEPGTYWIRRVMANERSVYEVRSNDGHFIGFINVIPTQRTGREDAEVDVSDPDAAGVQVLQAWYGQGQNIGYDVLYPRGDMQKLDQIAEMQAHSSGSAGQH
jgi:hypothetical protein